MEVYNKIFDWFVAARSSVAGVEVVREFTQDLRPGAKILDIGCGHGSPIAKTLCQIGFKLYGIDSSIKMATRCKKDLPAMAVQCSNVLNSDFFDTIFDAIIAYGFIIHLPQNQQTQIIEKVSEHLQHDGSFLFNSGDEDGESMTAPGYNGGERFMNYSMSCPNYKKVLQENGMILSNHYVEKEFGGTIYIAKKISDHKTEEIKKHKSINCIKSKGTKTTAVTA